MNHDTTEFDQSFAELKKSYKLQLPYKISEIGDNLENIKHGNQSRQLLEALHRQFHTLAGTAGTFSFLDISSTAKNLEQMILKWMEKNEDPAFTVEPNDIPIVFAEFENLKKITNAAVLTGDFTMRDTNALHPMDSIHKTGSPIKTIYVLDDEEITLEHIAAQVTLYGYEVVTFSNVLQFQRAVLERTPDAAIVDVVFPEDELAGIKAVEPFKEALGFRLPVIFLSIRSDFGARLEAVRVGGSAYIEKPYDISDIVDKLDELTFIKKEDPYKVLIIEDDEILASYYELILKQVGVHSVIVPEPDLFIKTMRNFAPDLVLLDIYMTWCNGMEMAKIIRQMNEYVATPIVYLTSETNPDQKMLAMGFGADDYLTKPIQPDHLITSVLTRVRRHRVLKSYMIKDSLTGLLNHASLEQELLREVARAARYAVDFSFAIIDIDNFKKVNDSHGHQVGDQVIKSLSRMLKQRLRETDVIGRIGGEEFGIIFIGSDAPHAFKLLDDIRNHFSKIEFKNNHDEKFFLTISCGISSWQKDLSNIQIHMKADNAMYQAKNTGKNQVIIG